MGFCEETVEVRKLSDDRWELTEPLHYCGNVEVFEVETEKPTDFASVPRVLWWLFPRYGEYTKAAILHDYLCGKADVGEFNRADADGIFRRSMREQGVPFLRRWVMWAAVRFGSGPRSLLARPGEALLATAWGIASLVFLLVPAVVVTVWLVLAWLLEWLASPLAYLVSEEDEKVNLPWPVDDEREAASQSSCRRKPSACLDDGE